MLNLFNQKKNIKKNINTHDIIDNKVILISSNKTIENSKQFKKDKIINYPVVTKEWFNSIYTYNKEYIKSLIYNDSIIYNLIQKIFNWDNNSYLKKYKRIIKKRTKSKHYTIKYKIFVSKADLKHTNNKVIIIFYTYNNLSNTFKKNLIKKRFNLKKLNYNIIYKYLQGLRSLSKINDKRKKYIIFLNLLKAFLKRKKKNYLKKVISYLILKKKLMLIRYRFEQFLISQKPNLVYLIKHIYDKEVEFKIINLKLKHLNSDILSQYIVLQLKNRKNRLLKVLKKSIRKVRILPRHLYLITNNDTNIFKDNFLNYIKFKAISGIRLEARGRLTRRLTASRSTFKFKYKGSLKNIDSSYKNQSSILLRGHLKSNLQYTIINSKTRNGAFGLKSWISSY